MKRLTFLSIALLASLFLLGNVQVAEARDGLMVYSVAASTYPVTENATLSADISDYPRIMKIGISTDDATVAQTITFYEQADSTTTVTAKYVVYIDSNNVTSGNQMIDFYNLGTYWYSDNIAARKSGTGSTVRITYWYW